MNIAEYISKRLAGMGVRYVFGIPGGPSIPYMEAFRRAGLDFILTSEERSAGFMAAVTARLSGVPGVCHATLGPGATNLLTGVGSAFLDRSPVMALTSEMADEWLNRTAQMNVNHQQLFTPLTKATRRLTEGSVGEDFGFLFREALREYPGPVHAGLPAGLDAKTVNEPETRKAGGKKIRASGKSLEDAVRLIRKSKKPLLVAGLTASRLVPGGEFEKMISRHRLPVIITPMAKGIINEDNQYYGGVLFHALSDRLKEVYNRCDLVIGFGYDQVEYNYESWVPDVPVLHLDTVNSDLPAGKEIASLAGEPPDWFRALSELPRSGQNELRDGLRDIREDIKASFRRHTGHFGPVAVLKTLREFLPPETIITADVGSHLHLIGQYWQTNGIPGLIMTNGWSSMGFGIPAAVAAGLCRPKSRVVCITGDGGFIMAAGEIVTARRIGIPVIIIVLSDGELNLIRLKQSWRDVEPCGTTLYEGDLFGSGSFLGAKVCRAGSVKMLRQALHKAWISNAPVIINAVIESVDYNNLVVRQ